ncbi:MAG: hypothetical protein E7623_01125 [Ruminococcaceae bacterium]|nr:hypothetical protein [Oscillospiraceae bacterium]
MFIIERLMGVSTYSAMLLFACMMIAFSTIRLRYIFRIYTIILTIMGFLYVPSVQSDLYRINESIRLLGTMDFRSFFDTFVEGSTIPAANVFYWIIGQIGILRILPAFTVFVCYNCIFYIFWKTAEIYKVSRANISIALLFFMSIGTYIFVVSNIRTMLALSIIAYCFFKETVEKKKSIKYMLLYVCAVLIHNLAVIVFLFRIFAPIFKKERAFVYRTMHFMAFALALGFLLIYAKDFTNKIFYKAESYLFGNVYSYFWDYLIGVIVLIVEICVAFTYMKQKKAKEGYALMSDYGFLLMVCILVSIVSFNSFSVFHRITTYFSPIIATPLLMLLIQKYRDGGNPVGESNLQRLVILTSGALLFLACFRGSLCSYKFFVLG